MDQQTTDTMPGQSAWEIFFNKKRSTLTINRYDRKQQRTYQLRRVTPSSWGRLCEFMAYPGWRTRYENDVWFNVSNVRMR